jgi:anti-sigma28 factor (negative regulator of flagellin synthesis)
MRVNDRNALGSAAAETGRAQETQKTGREEGARSGRADSSGDRVELSSNLGRLSQAISSFSSQRAERVQSLAAEYQSGSYRPDAQATSRAMITDALTAGS